MKRFSLLSSLLLLAVPGLFAQVTTSFQMPETNEPVITVQFTGAGLTAMTTTIVDLPLSATTTTLAAPVGLTDTTVTLTSASGLAPNNGLFVDSEMMNVVSISGNVVTVGRGMVGLTATTHANGATVTKQRFGSYGALAKFFMQNGFQFSPIIPQAPNSPIQ